MMSALSASFLAGRSDRMGGTSESTPGKPVAIIGSMTLEHVSDEELVACYQSKTDTAERELYVNGLFRRNYARVGRWCLRFAPDREAVGYVFRI